MFESFSTSTTPTVIQTTDDSSIPCIDDYKVGVWITKPIQRKSNSSVSMLNFKYAKSYRTFADHHALIIYAAANHTNIIIEFSNSNSISFCENVDLSQWCIERKPKNLNHSKQIVKNALLMLDWQMEYNIFSNNCEHFVNACYYNNKHSKQVTQVTQVKYSIFNGIGCGSVGVGSGFAIMYPYLRQAKTWQGFIDIGRHQRQNGYGICSGLSDADFQQFVKNCGRWVKEAQKNIDWTKKMTTFSVTMGFICGVTGWICHTKYKQRNYRENVFDEDERTMNFERKIQRKIVKMLRDFRSNMEQNLIVDGYLRCLQIEEKEIGKLIGLFYDAYHLRQIMINDIFEIIDDLC